jgi:hypothetical protein
MASVTHRPGADLWLTKGATVAVGHENRALADPGVQIHVELLARLYADLPQRRTVVRADPFSLGQFVANHRTRQRWIQRLAPGLAALVARDLDAVVVAVFFDRRLGLGALGLGLVEEQVLLGLTVLRPASLLAANSCRLNLLSCSCSRSRSARNTRTSPANDSFCRRASASACCSAAISSGVGMRTIGAHSLGAVAPCASRSSHRAVTAAAAGNQLVQWFGPAAPDQAARSCSRFGCRPPRHRSLRAADATTPPSARARPPCSAR